MVECPSADSQRRQAIKIDAKQVDARLSLHREPSLILCKHEFEDARDAVTDDARRVTPQNIQQAALQQQYSVDSTRNLPFHDNLRLRACDTTDGSLEVPFRAYMRAYSEPPARAAGRLYDNGPRLGKELAGLSDVIRSKCDVLGHRQSRLFQEPRDDRLIGRHTERGRPVQIGILMLDSRANVVAGDL